MEFAVDSRLDQSQQSIAINTYMIPYRYSFLQNAFVQLMNEKLFIDNLITIMYGIRHTCFDDLPRVTE